MKYYDIDPDKEYEEEMQELNEAEEAREWEEFNIENEFSKNTNEYIEFFNIV